MILICLFSSSFRCQTQNSVAIYFNCRLKHVFPYPWEVHIVVFCLTVLWLQYVRTHILQVWITGKIMLVQCQRRNTEVYGTIWSLPQHNTTTTTQQQQQQQQVNRMHDLTDRWHRVLESKLIEAGWGKLCVSKQDHHQFRWWFIVWSAPSHYRNRCRIIINWTDRNKLHWNLNKNTKHFVENFVCKWRLFSGLNESIH